MESVVISKKLLKRLPMYLAHLKSLPEESNVSATAMARALGLGEVMVRKDLAKISETGRRRTGRCRERLIRDIEEYLYLAAFDLDPDSPESGNGKPIYPMSRLESFCRYYHVLIGIITVPAENAQAVCDLLVSSGVSAIWNFAPVHLQVPDYVVVQSENLAVSLTALRIHMRKQKPA